MRDLTACLIAVLRLLLPPSGRHRATPAEPAVEPTPGSEELDDFPHTKTSSWARYYGHREPIPDAHGLALVRPYFVACEQRAERERQRERRTAAALAPAGIDYDVALVA